MRERVPYENVVIIVRKFDETFDEEIDKTPQIFDFIIVLLFVSLFCGSKTEPLYFL